MTAGMVYLLNGPFGGGMMRGGYGGFFLGGLMTVVWTALLVLFVLWIVRNRAGIRAAVHRSAAALQPDGPALPAQTPLEIVQTRYAKGELTRDEYETMRRDLLGETPVTAA